MSAPHLDTSWSAFSSLFPLQLSWESPRSKSFCVNMQLDDNVPIAIIMFHDAIVAQFF